MKRKSSGKSNVHDLLADMVPPPDINDKWFVCMNSETKSTQGPSKFKTKIYISHAPISFTKAMNCFGTFDPIKFTQQNEKNSEAGRGTTMVDGVKRRSSNRGLDKSGIKKKYRLVCVVGPMNSVEMANRFMKMWSVSRGIQPRAVYAGLLAKELNLQISLNLDALFDAENKGFRVICIPTPKEKETGMKIKFVKSELENSSHEANKTPSCAILSKRKRAKTDSSSEHKKIKT